MSDWITPEDVAAYLDVAGAPDDRMVDSTAAIRAAVERRRADLTFTDDATVPADVRQGSIAWAALLWQQRSAPSGFTGYGDETQLVDTLGSRRAEILRLVGWRRPVVG